MTRPIAHSKTVPLFVLAVCAIAAFGLACAQQGGAPGGTAGDQAAMTHADSLELGRRMSMVGGCNDCHTPGTFYGATDTTRRLSGSELGWTGPWGTTFPRNLTPDPETGIGSWTAQDIVTAIREGRRPDNSPILPPMPWPMYAHFSDLEAYSLALYLKSIPAVSHAMPPAVPPGQPATRPALAFPPPPEWDAANLPAGAVPTGGH
jgi:hypothetical protein